MASTDSGRNDPVENYYRPLIVADKASDLLFYVTATVSILALLVDRKSDPIIYSIVQSSFALCVLILFILSLSVRLYLSPRAQEARFTDFASHAFDRNLNHELTSGYYNNSVATGWRRAASQLLENTFYTKDTLSKMCIRARIGGSAYVALWIVVALNRSSDLAIVGVAAQIVFSEQILSKWSRIEWLRRRCETIYVQLYRLIQGKGINDAITMEMIGHYEIAKATAAVILSSKIFNTRASTTDAEWAKVRKALGI